MGPLDGTPRHKVESIASGTRSLCCHTLGTRATQARAPGPGENGPLPSLKNISDCKRRPAEIGGAAIPLIHNNVAIRHSLLFGDINRLSVIPIDMVPKK